MAKLICPDCGCKTDNLIQHSKLHHHDIINKNDFYRYYPDYEGKLTIDKRIPGEYKCPYCGKIYDRQNSLALHIKNVHPEHYVPASESKHKVLEKQECPICHKMTGDMRQHVKKHGYMDWEKFCTEYGWDVKKSKIVSEEYRQKLSQNKTEFYKTDRGLELRSIQSIKYRGDGNPAKNPAVMEKSIANRSSRGNMAVNNSIIGVKVSYRGITFRSYNEFRFYIGHQILGMNIIYEPNNKCVRWYNEAKKFNTSYLPDFYIPRTRELIELKSCKFDYQRALTGEKYKKVQAVYDKIGETYVITYPRKYYIEHLNLSNAEYIKLNDNIDNKIREEAFDGFVEFAIPDDKESQILFKLFGELVPDIYKLPFVKIIEFNRKGNNKSNINI